MGGESTEALRGETTEGRTGTPGSALSRRWRWIDAILSEILSEIPSEILPKILSVILYEILSILSEMLFETFFDLRYCLNQDIV